MAPPAKKATGAAKPKAAHASYQDMITDAIVNVCFLLLLPSPFPPASPA